MIFVFILLLALIILAYGQKIYFKKIALNDIEVNISYDCQKIQAGKEFKVIEEITNNSKRDIRDIKLILLLDNNFIGNEDDFSKASDKKYFQEIFSLNSMESVKRELSFTCNKRGVYPIEKCFLVVSDIYYNNFFKKEVKLNSELVVYPEETNLPKVNNLLENIVGEIESRTSIFEDPFLFQGIREYQTYDTFKMINWNQSAKTGELKVNKAVYTADRQVNIILDLSSDNLIVEDYLMEELIKVSCKLCQMLLQQGIGVGFISNISKGENGFFRLDVGYSINHIEKIRYFLSKIDLNAKKMPLEAVISESINQSLNKSNLSPYVLISSQNNENINRLWQRLLLLNKDSLFLNILDKEDPQIILNKANTITWRVA